MNEQNSSPKEGGLYAFLEGSELYVGALVGLKGSSWKLLCQDQRERNLPARRILSHCGNLPSGLEARRDLLLERLGQLKAQIFEEAAKVDLETLWEALGPREELLEPAWLASTWFGSQVSPAQATAMLWAILTESIHFKVKGHEIQVQPPEAVEQKKLQAQQEAEREKLLRQVHAWMNGGPPPEAVPDLIGLLKEVALFGQQAPRFAEARELLRKIEHRAKDEAATSFEILVRVGIWARDENLELLREGAPQEAEPEILEEAARAAKKEFDPATRHDWSAFETFSVDPSQTLDVDDAFSCWMEGEELRVAIHITDVTEFIEPQGALDRDARMRGLSIYLPNKIIPMLPPCLSERAASLLPGQPRPAITLHFKATEEGVPESPRFELSRVVNSRKLSYADLDEMLPRDPLLQRLLRFCAAHRQRRMEQGAILLPLPEVALRLEEDGRVQVHIERDSASHQLVSELMICFNSSVARFCQENQIPALFRGQPPPRRRMLSEKPTLLECLLQRRQMLKSVTGLEAARHGGLGLEAYTMVTSPLRRYLDLCMEMQLHAFLRGLPLPWDPKKLEELLPYLEVAQKRTQRIERATERYWMHRWIEQRPEPIVQALWLDPMSGQIRAALLPFLTEVQVDLNGQRPPRRGTLVELQVASVQPRDGELKLLLRGHAKSLNHGAEILAEYFSL